VGKLDFRIAFQLHFDESPKVTIRGVIDDPHPATAELVRWSLIEEPAFIVRVTVT